MEKEKNKKKEIDKVMSSILDCLIGIDMINTYDDGSYETINPDIEIFNTELQNHWVRLKVIINKMRKDKSEKDINY